MGWGGRGGGNSRRNLWFLNFYLCIWLTFLFLLPIFKHRKILHGLHRRPVRLRPKKTKIQRQKGIQYKSRLESYTVRRDKDYSYYTCNCYLGHTSMFPINLSNIVDNVLVFCITQGFLAAKSFNEINGAPVDPIDFYLQKMLSNRLITFSYFRHTIPVTTGPKALFNCDGK